MALFNAEKDAKAQANAENKKKKSAAKAVNKVEKDQAEEKKRTQLLPGFKDDFAKGTAHALSLTNDCMRDFIRYFFQKQVKGLGQLGKAKLVDILQPLLHSEGGAESDSGNFSMC